MQKKKFYCINFSMAIDAPNGSQNLNGNERETNTPNSNPNPNPPLPPNEDIQLWKVMIFIVANYYFVFLGVILTIVGHGAQNLEAPSSWFLFVKDLDKPNSTEASKIKITTNADKDRVQGNLPLLG